MNSEFFELKKIVANQRKIVKELLNLSKNIKKVESKEEKQMFDSQINSLKKNLAQLSKEALEKISKISIVQPLPVIKTETKKEVVAKKEIPKKQNRTFVSRMLDKKPESKIKTSEFERDTIKRIKGREAVLEEKTDKKASKYVQLSNKYFGGKSMQLIKEGKFDGLKRDLIKSNLQYLPKSYISIIFFTTIIAAIISFFIFVFLLFFQVSVTIPFITLTQESILTRLGKVFWILVLIPLSTFFMMYLYPSVEKKSIEGRINQELPFAAINMAAIAGSMLDPTKIFEIIISTKEYPYLEKEFTKLINETNVLGYDLVTSLRNRAFNSPSKKLAELFNGLATTINSGGDLVEFFQKRSQTLLFDYRLEREKYTRSAETFMDIYISVVIAAPMILMLLLMMMKISGLGVSLSTSAITLIMVLGVSIVNIAFITFLHLKQPAE